MNEKLSAEQLVEEFEEAISAAQCEAECGRKADPAEYTAARAALLAAIGELDEVLAAYASLMRSEFEGRGGYFIGGSDPILERHGYVKDGYWTGKP